MSLEETLALIKSRHRGRCFMMEQRKRAQFAVGAFIRKELGWSKSLPERERKAIAKRAKAVLAGTDGPEELREIAAKTLAGTKEPFAKLERKGLREVTAAAKTLPVWQSFGADVRGFGAASLGVILAEAGDLSNYSTHSKLWKRMGLAVMDGVRQGGLRKGAAKDDWIAHGYNRQRRSRMWNIGDALIKGNREGRYRTIYIERKAFEVSRAPEMSPMHAHLRAQRYMEKKLLRDLWGAWRRATLILPATAILEVPVADIASPQRRKRAA